MFITKTKNFQSAVARLAEGLDEYKTHPSSTVRDGVIQRFEFTFELSWKALREYMLNQGSTAPLQFPKQVLKEAYACQLIFDEHVWLDMLSARNTTSHIYDDKQATTIMSDIEGHFLKTLQALADILPEQ